MSRLKWLYCERFDVMALVELKPGRLPLMYICDDIYANLNPFFSYPLSFMPQWIEIGEL